MLSAWRLGIHAARGAALWRLHGGAALFAFGGACALTHLIDELSLHTVRGEDGLLLGAAAVCCGAIGGLWLPRVLILRRLRLNPPQGGPHAADPATGPAGRPGPPLRAWLTTEGFESSLVGTLFLVCGLTLLILLLGAPVTEWLRGLLARRFMLPRGVALTALLVPPLAGLALTAAFGATALLAVHGLYRMVGTATSSGVDQGAASARAPIAPVAPRARPAAPDLADDARRDPRPTGGPARFWSVVLLAGAGGSLAAVLVEAHLAAAAVALPPVFLSAALASTGRPGRDGGVGGPHSALAGGPLAGDARPRLALSLPASAVAAAFTMASGLSVAIADDRAPLLVPQAALAWVGLWAAGGTLIGQWVGRRAPRSAAALPLSLLALAVTCLGLDAAPGAAIGHYGRLAALTLVAAAVIVLAARRVAALGRGIQLALSVVGACVAGGFVLGALTASTAAAPAATPMSWLAVPILAGLAAALLAHDARIPHRLGRVGLAVAAAWLPVAAVGGAIAVRAAPGAPASPQPAARTREAGRAVLASALVRCRVADAAGRAESDASDSVWAIDLYPHKRDLIVVAAGICERDRRARSARGAGRLLARCAAGLRPGGRIVIEEPAGPVAAAALAYAARSAARRPPEVYRCRVSAGDAPPYSVLLIGSDVPAWIAESQRRRPAGVALTRVGSAAVFVPAIGPATQR